MVGKNLLLFRVEYLVRITNRTHIKPISPHIHGANDKVDAEPQEQPITTRAT